jgi:hypothetical protein
MTNTQILKMKIFNKSLGSGTPSGITEEGVETSTDSAQDKTGKKRKTQKNATLRYSNRLAYSFIVISRFSVIF